MKKVGLFVGAMVLVFGSYARADSVTVGVYVPDNQDCVPFGCMQYAQFIYDASYFSGPFTITGLTFFDTLEDAGACSPECYDPATYTFSLSTTAATVAAPSATYANNRGGDFQTFTTVILSGPTGPVFTFTGAPFAYDPSGGNLLLEIAKSAGSSPSAYTSHTDRDDEAVGGPLLVSRIFGFDATSGDVETNVGPITRFDSESSTSDFASSATVPEPATLTLTGLGLFGVVTRRLRKNKKATPPAV